MTLKPDVTLGAKFVPSSNHYEFSLYSKHATRVELALFDRPRNPNREYRVALAKGEQDCWHVAVSTVALREHAILEPIHYGYRVWGPNWPFANEWRPGTAIGYQSDVDDQGNRFNPNKLLIDPYAREISHDPEVAPTLCDPNLYADPYYGGGSLATGTAQPSREIDTGPMAPKSIVFRQRDTTRFGEKPNRPLKDDIIYEVNLRGLTMLDESIPRPERGTYKGATAMAQYLSDLGVTAIELLPIQAFASEQNDDGDPRGDNYWGYMTLAFFAPNRRYAFDKTPGGPTREFKEMVGAFHAKGIKVFLDVVYNHTGEGPLKRRVSTPSWTTRDEIERAQQEVNRSRDARSPLQDDEAACLLSFAGIDNATYYRLESGNRRYVSHGGCGGNLDYDAPVVQKLIVESLKYWADEMGVDGFRFDLAPVLGSVWRRDRLVFDPGCDLYTAIVRELPARPCDEKGVDLIAEPWGGPDPDPDQYPTKEHHRIFPQEWAVWNPHFRNAVKRAENKYNHVFADYDNRTTHNGILASVVAGSSSPINKKPWNSINYVASHDDCNAMRPLVSFNRFFHLMEGTLKENNDAQESWDHQGNTEWQRRAARNWFTLLMFSAGVPMFTGGDEVFRGIPAYAPGTGMMDLVGVDGPISYIDYSCLREPGSEGQRMQAFVSRLCSMRNKHPCLRRAEYYTGKPGPRSGLKDITWYDRDGQESIPWGDPDFLACRIDAAPNGVSEDGVFSIYLAYNIGPNDLRVVFPQNLDGKRYYGLVDTDDPDGRLGNGDSIAGGEARLVCGRSIQVLLEK